jgi:hypothetical protein
MDLLLKLAMPILCGCAASAGAPIAHAAQIVVGQVAPLSGPEASQGTAYAAGLRLYFNSINNRRQSLWFAAVRLQRASSSSTEQQAAPLNFMFTREQIWNEW